MKHWWVFVRMGVMILFLIIAFQTPVFSAQKHSVKQGETLFGIAKKYGVSVASIREANKMQDDRLRINQTLIIPGGQRAAASAPATPRNTASASAPVQSSRGAATYTYYKVKKGDTLGGIARSQRVSVADLQRMNNLRGSSSIREGSKLIVAVTYRQQQQQQQQSEPEEEITPLTAEEWAAIERDSDANTGYLGPWKSAKERQLLVKVALSFIGAPYRSGGGNVRGVDSPGFVQKVYEIFDVSLPRDVLGQSRLGKKVDRLELCEGDVLFFHGPSNAGIVGIYVGDNRFVHASPSGKREVRVSNFDDFSLSSRFIKAVRLRYVEGEV